jgi:hypothetical protein
MNERIKELAEKSGLYNFVLEAMGIDEEMGKFAELIVKECVKIVTDNHESLITSPLHPGDLLKEHFGVE